MYVYEIMSHTFKELMRDENVIKGAPLAKTDLHNLVCDYDSSEALLRVTAPRKIGEKITKQHPNIWQYPSTLKDSEISDLSTLNNLFCSYMVSVKSKYVVTVDMLRDDSPERLILVDPYPFHLKGLRDLGVCEISEFPDPRTANETPNRGRAPGHPNE